MSRYKDADRLLAILVKRCDEADNQEAWFAYARACGDVRDLPVADVVDVVRCKDCKHFEKWHTEVTGDTGYYCVRPNQQTCNLSPEDYCSYGERKDG